MATLVIKRKSSMNGCAQNHEVYLGENFIGLLKNGETLEIPIEVGTHKLYFNNTFKWRDMNKDSVFQVTVNDPDERIEITTCFGTNGEYEAYDTNGTPIISILDNTQTTNPNNNPPQATPNDNTSHTQGIFCPACNSRDVVPITEVTTVGEDFNTRDACCGYLLCGPLGLLFGAPKEEKRTITTVSWVCRSCGSKFKL